MRRQFAILLASISGTLLVPAVALAASTTVVTPANPQGFATYSTTSGGTVSFVNDTTAPFGRGALQLTTDDTIAAKAQYLKNTVTPLKDVGTLSYYTKQTAAKFVGGLPAYQLPSCLYGVTPTGCVTRPGDAKSGFTTLTYEPYINEGNAAVKKNVWQKWNVSDGKFYSSRAVGSLQLSQGSSVYTLSQLNTEFPNAVVFQFGVNIGSNNPGYVVQTDGLEFNGVVYDFETALVGPPTNVDQCKNNGFQDFNNPMFKNQGQCVSYVRGHNGSNGNNTKVNIRNNNTQSSTTGGANSTGNTNGGSASSGEASNNNTNNTTVRVTN